MECYSKFSLLNWMNQASFIHLSHPSSAFELCSVSYVLGGTFKHTELLFHSRRPSLSFIVFPLLSVLTSFPLAGLPPLSLLPSEWAPEVSWEDLSEDPETLLQGHMLSPPGTVSWWTFHCLRVCKFQDTWCLEVRHPEKLASYSPKWNILQKTAVFPYIIN